MDYKLIDPRTLELTSATMSLLGEVAAATHEFRQQRPFDPDLAAKIRRALLPDRVTASLNMEGVNVTRRQTLAMMDALRVQENAGAGELEVYNALAADEFIADQVEQGEQLTEGMIRHINTLLIRGLRDDAGQWRPGDVTLLGAKLVPPPGPAVPALMRQLIDWFPITEAFDPIVQASWLHNQFTYVHPFNDGNGRTGRLLQDWALIRRGLWPTGIPNERRDDYYAALEQADNGRWDDLVELIALLQLDVASKVRAVIDEASDRAEWVSRLASAAATKQSNARHKQYLVWRSRVEDVSAAFRQAAEELDGSSDIIGATFRDYSVVEFREWDRLCKVGTGDRTWLFSILAFAGGKPFYKTIAYLKRHVPLPEADPFPPPRDKIGVYFTGVPLPEEERADFHRYADADIRLREILPFGDSFYIYSDRTSYNESADLEGWVVAEERSVGKVVERYFLDMFERKAGLGA